jgi:xanthine dehydrogenase small subunit
MAGRGGRRTTALADFFTAYRRTVLERGEILTAIDIPKPFPEILRFYKIAKRPMDDISTVAAAMALDRDSAGRIRRARFAFGGMAATPIRVVEAERAIEGSPWNETAVARVQQVMDATLRPMSDHRGSAPFRLEVAKRLVEKFYWERPQ